MDEKVRLALDGIDNIDVPFDAWTIKYLAKIGLESIVRCGEECHVRDNAGQIDILIWEGDKEAQPRYFDVSTPSKRASAFRRIAKENIKGPIGTRIKEIMATPNDRRKLFQVMLDGGISDEVIATAFERFQNTDGIHWRIVHAE